MKETDIFRDKDSGRLKQTETERQTDSETRTQVDSGRRRRTHMFKDKSTEAIA